MKNYIGSAKEKFDGNVISVTLYVEKINEFIYEKDGRKYLTFDVTKKREVDQHGKTHSVSVWKPDTEQRPQSTNQEPVESNPFSSDDLPF